jgi:hypothetical protein
VVNITDFRRTLAVNSLLFRPTPAIRCSIAEKRQAVGYLEKGAPPFGGNCDRLSTQYWALAIYHFNKTAESWVLWKPPTKDYLG